MTWEPWPKVEARHLARYVTPDAIRVSQLIQGRDDILRKPNGRRIVVRTLYEALVERNISYAPEKYDPQEERQQIRTPAEILKAPREGTCLDLSVLFCGLCLGFDLLPVLIVVEGHALAAVSLERGLREWQDFGRREIEHFDRGLLEDPEPLRRLVDQQSYIALECTGFAHSKKLHGAAPEEQNRSDGVLTFEQAIEVGRRQLEETARPFRFALDISSLQYRWGVPPFVCVDLEELTQKLEQIAAKYTILAQADRPKFIPARLRERLNRLLERHALFGGRDRELGRLDAFVTDCSSGYCFVTGKPGFGKTALLANWVRRLEARKEKVAYHFISRLDDLAGEDFALRSLCQQLATLHGLRGELPASVAELRSLYPQLLGLPPGDARRVIVVLDGLDEAQGWEIRADLFPSRLPAGVFVVFSARDTGQDWLETLELEPGQILLEKLATLGTGEIAQLLQSVGGAAAERAAESDFVNAVLECSSGDPFFLRYLVEDIRDNPILTVAQLQEQPKGLVKYLDSWWKQVSETVGEQPVRDLLGYLVVAKGRMGRDDLTSVSAEDQLDGFVFENALEKLRRFVTGSDDEGYALCHPRFQHYLTRNRIKAQDQKPYREHILDYCAAWEEHRSRYVLKHYAEHLDEIGRRSDLLELLQANWIQAKWEIFGSYSALLGDLDVACRACLKEPRDDAAIAGLAIARQTSRELMQSFPTDLLVAWVELGEINRVLEVLAGLSDYRGYSAQPLIAVAEALMSAKSDHWRDVAELISRALGVLPLIRISSKRLETLDAAVRVLSSELSLDLPHRHTLLQDAEEFMRGVNDPAFLVAAAGRIADAWARRDADRPRAQSLLEVARERLTTIDFAPDRLFAVAWLLPALRRLDPGAVSQIVRDVFDRLADPFAASTMTQTPLSDLLRNWTTDPVDSVGDIVARVEALAAMTRADRDYEPGSRSEIVLALCRLGRTETAAQFVDEAWELSPVDAARMVLLAVDELHESMPQRTKDWVTAAGQYRFPVHHDLGVDQRLFTSLLAVALAEIGDWNGCMQMADELPADNAAEVRSECIRISERRLEGNPDALRAIVVRLAAVREEARPDKRATCYALAARVLRELDPVACRELLGRAVETCLTKLPGGEIDDLLQLLAIAKHEDGDRAGVEATLKRMEWPSKAAETLARLVAATPEKDFSGMGRYAALLSERVRAGDDRLFVVVFDQAVAVANRIGPFAPDAARELCEAVTDGVWKLRGWPDRLVRTLAGVASARARFDAAAGIKGMDALIGMIEDWLAQGEELRARVLVDIARHLRALEGLDGAAAEKREQRLRALFHRFPEPDDEIMLECDFAVSLAARNPDGAIDLLREQIQKIPAFADLPPHVPHLQRMISESTGRIVGPRARQAKATAGVGRSIIAISPHRPDAAKNLLTDLLHAIQKIDSPNDLAEALADFFRVGRGAKADFFQAVSDVYLKAVVTADTLSDTCKVHALAVAVETYSAFGDFTSAQAVAERLPDENAKTQAERVVSYAKDRAQLGELSAFERAFVHVHRLGLTWPVLHLIKVSGETEEALSELANALASGELRLDRSGLLNWVGAMLIPARALGGTVAVASIVDSVTEFDRRLLDAGRLIAKAQA